MKIQNSAVFLQGESSRTESYTKEETLRMWVDGTGRQGESRQNSPGIGDGAVLELSEQGRALQNQAVSVEAAEEEELEISDRDKQKLLAIQKMIEVLTGKKIKFFLPKKIKLQNPDIQGMGTNPTRQGWGLIYEARETYREQEKLSFSAAAKVQTADGRTISVKLELSMSREFAASRQINIRAGDALKIDPLVINLDVPSAKLTDQKISFDLDADGKTDSISFLAPGSGFVALDRNGDGIVNDGSELFGAKTGDGFAELAVFDSDGNNWIDENDPIYEKLRIWTRDEHGRDSLFALGQKGVGAIYLGSVGTDFWLKNSENAATGQIRKTGFFLRESGAAGTMQHIDIVI